MKSNLQWIPVPSLDYGKVLNIHVGEYLALLRDIVDQIRAVALKDQLFPLVDSRHWEGVARESLVPVH